MEVFLKLKEHSIETEARKKCDRLIYRYFSKNCSDDRKPIIEAQIESLKYFLENADFKKLKSVHPELSDSEERLIKLVIPENQGEIEIIFNLIENL